MAYECEIVDIQEQMVLSIRVRTRPENLVGEMMAVARTIEDYLSQNDRDASSGPPFLISHGQDDQGVDAELCFPVSRELPGSETVKFGRVPSARTAACVYAGPYEGRSAAYDALKQWMKGHGHEPVGTVYEFNIDEKVPDPAEVKLRVAFPLVAPVTAP